MASELNRNWIYIEKLKEKKHKKSSHLMTLYSNKHLYFNCEPILPNKPDFLKLEEVTFVYFYFITNFSKCSIKCSIWLNTSMNSSNSKHYQQCPHVKIEYYDALIPTRSTKYYMLHQSV